MRLVVAKMHRIGAIALADAVGKVQQATEDMASHTLAGRVAECERKQRRRAVALLLVADACECVWMLVQKARLQSRDVNILSWRDLSGDGRKESDVLRVKTFEASVQM